TTIWSAAGELRPDSGPVTLGPPIANTQLYVLDPQMQLVPPGVPGELYIGGDGLARGYGGRPDLTAERFVPNPFGAGEDHEEWRTVNQEPGADDAKLKTQNSKLKTQPSSRLYKTGDLVRRLADGRIEFLGRLDHQVKVRGFRIELGEIETALRAHPDVREAVVLAREDRPGEKRLVAYIVLNQGPERESTKDTKGTNGAGQEQPVAQSQDRSTDDAELTTQNSKLKTHLRARLPDYMVPSAFVSLRAFPLTPNGKIDRRALPAPEAEAAPAQSDQLPRGELERTMLAIWAEVLQRERVGVRDNFFDQGGHSLLATRLMVRLQRAFGVDLPMRVLFEAPTPAGLAERVRAAQGREAPPPPEPAPADAAPVLSFAQERLWFLSQLEPDSTAYHTPLVLRLVGRLDRAALERALAQIVRRHAALRTGIALRNGQPAPTPIDATLPLALDDLSAQDGPARDAAVQRLLLAELGRPFDLERGPVVRARLLRLAADEHILLLVFHHIVCDGWSLALIQGELAAGYSGAPLPELPIQYSDFARWQRQWLDEARQEQLLAYWRARLAGLPRLELPTDRPRPAVRSTQGALHLLRLPAKLLAALDRLCRAEGATRFQVLLAAFQVLLARGSGQRDFAVGTPIAGRTTAAVEELVGFFVNMLVLRADLDGSACFRDLLRRVRATTLDAYAHQDLPFERLVEVLEPDRDLSRTPLVQVVLAFQNTPAATPHLPDLAIAPVALEHVTAKFDLTVIAQEQGDGLELAFEYATDLFDADTVARIGARLLTLLDAALDRPDQALDLLPLLPEAERREVLAWGTPAETPPCEETIHARFARQAAARPQDAALIDGAERLTYADLDRRANRLAHLLRARGVGPDIGVGVAVRRAADLLIALLGILKAGGVCVPLDRDYPPERIAYMLDNAGIGLVLTDTDSAGQFTAVGHRTAAIIDLWVERALIDAQPETTPPEICAPEHLAYVLYTSGSTGRPKGVQITHRAVTRLVLDTNYIDIRPDDRIAQVANISFDAAIFEIWSALLHGACLVSFARDVALSPKDFAHGLREAGVTILFLTTALFNQQVREAPDSFAGLRYAVFGGEAADPRRVRELLLSSPPARLLNAYGPTESTTFATWHLLREVAEDAASVPIGVPVSKTTLYVLDRHMQLVPPGVPGELYIGGDGLARGYGGRPDLTAERFVPNPFGAGGWGTEPRTENQEPDPNAAELKTQNSKLTTQQASRLYKTGDLVRWTRDGVIEFVARIDAQVKIRGFRIEPGEIEALLASHPDVREALVLVREDGGDKRLVAYVVPVGQPEQESTKDTKGTNGSGQEKPVAQGQHLGADGAGLKTQHATLRTFLQERLPPYMVPAAFVVLERFPLTPNGKVDRAVLPPPGDEDLARTDSFVAPRSALEEVLAGVWADLLGLARVGVEESFFALGGHSLLVTQLAAQLRTLFRVDLPLRAVFEATTVADQAALLVAHEPRPGQMERVAQFLQTLHQQQVRNSGNE
ncbi:MAG TPA: amino acid adenylation domain-containing protein, partial [Roseiflexaceae bacterium]|nr:amino acid adenylation domain-containing protein [Roseiflexaceae bacterium]